MVLGRRISHCGKKENWAWGGVWHGPRREGQTLRCRPRKEEEALGYGPRREEQVLGCGLEGEWWCMKSERQRSDLATPWI